MVKYYITTTTTLRSMREREKGHAFIKPEIAISCLESKKSFHKTIRKIFERCHPVECFCGCTWNNSIDCCHVRLLGSAIHTNEFNDNNDDSIYEWLLSSTDSDVPFYNVHSTFIVERPRLQNIHPVLGTVWPNWTRIQLTDWITPGHP